MSEKADGGLTFEECKESLDTFSAWKSPGTVLEKMAFRWMARVLCNFFWSYWEWLKVVFHLRRKTFVVNNFFSILLLITCYRLAFFVIDNFLWSTTICLVRRGPLLSQELSYSTSLSDFTDEELETSCRQLKNQEQELVVRPFPSYLVPLFLNESSCKTFWYENEFDYAEHISAWMVSHEDSFWHRGKEQYDSGLFALVIGLKTRATI